MWKSSVVLEVNGETGTNEEPENISLMPHNTTHPTRMEYNASHMVGNGSVNSYKRETEMDAKKNHQFCMIRDNIDFLWNVEYLTWNNHSTHRTIVAVWEIVGDIH